MYLSRAKEESQGDTAIFSRSTDGVGAPALMDRAQRLRYPNDWTQFGDRLVYTTSGRSSGFDLGYLERKEPDGPFEAVEFLASAFHERLPKISPDGLYLAYCSDESGRDEVYVQSFPAGGGKLRISENGGCGPRWSAGGEELFYVEGDEVIYAVPVKTQPRFSAGRPVELFRHNGFVGNIPDYDVSADGERFVLVEAVGESEAARPLRIHIVQNWFTEFRDKQN
jgi:hypothetical protein